MPQRVSPGAIASAAKPAQAGFAYVSEAEPEELRSTALLPELRRDVFAQLLQHNIYGRIHLLCRRAVFQLGLQSVEQVLWPARSRAESAGKMLFQLDRASSNLV